MMLWGLLAGGLVGSACAGVGALLGGTAATCGALVCAGGALGIIGAEGMRVRHAQERGVGGWIDEISDFLKASKTV